LQRHDGPEPVLAPFGVTVRTMLLEDWSSLRGKGRFLARRPNRIPWRPYRPQPALEIGHALPEERRVLGLQPERRVDHDGAKRRGVAGKIHQHELRLIDPDLAEVGDHRVVIFRPDPALLNARIEVP